jgi:hypothetical protein
MEWRDARKLRARIKRARSFLSRQVKSIDRAARVRLALDEFAFNRGTQAEKASLENLNQQISKLEAVSRGQDNDG